MEKYFKIKKTGTPDDYVDIFDVHDALDEYQEKDCEVTEIPDPSEETERVRDALTKTIKMYEGKIEKIYRAMVENGMIDGKPCLCEKPGKGEEG